jgi:hypothetical protein
MFIGQKVSLVATKRPSKNPDSKYGFTAHVDNLIFYCDKERISENGSKYYWHCIIEGCPVRIVTDSEDKITHIRNKEHEGHEQLAAQVSF